VLPDRAFTGAAPAPIVVPLPANSRTTVPVSVEFRPQQRLVGVSNVNSFGATVFIF